MLKLAYKINYQDRSSLVKSKSLKFAKKFWNFSLYYGKFMATRPEERNEI